jgi:AcrR family transcriptional regulator
MRRLAEELGCAVGTIYLHFKSKDELVQLLVEESFERLWRALVDLGQRHRTGDPVLLLEKALYSYVEFGLCHANDYRFAFLLNPRGPPSACSGAPGPGSCALVRQPLRR